MAGTEHAGAQFDEHFNRRVDPERATYDIKPGTRYSGISVIYQNEHSGKTLTIPGHSFTGEMHGVWGSGHKTDPAVEVMRQARGTTLGTGRDAQNYWPSHVQFSVPNPEAPNGVETRSHFFRNSPMLDLSPAYPGKERTQSGR